MNTTAPIIPQLSRAARALRELGVSEVWLFGSFAEGRAEAGSDVDLAMRGLPPGFLVRAMVVASEILQREVSLVSLDEASPFTNYLIKNNKLRRVD